MCVGPIDMLIKKKILYLKILKATESYDIYKVPFENCLVKQNESEHFESLHERGIQKSI